MDETMKDREAVHCTPQRQRIKKSREQRAKEGYALNLKRNRRQINNFIGIRMNQQ